MSSHGKLKFLKLALGLGMFLHVPVAEAQDKTVLDLQFNKSEQILDIMSEKGDKNGFVRLVNINPEINIWYLLSVVWPGTNGKTYYHLENPAPKGQRIVLENSYVKGIKLVQGKQIYQCPLFPDFAVSELENARKSAKTFAPICEGRLFLRNQTKGNETTKEYVADLLRKHVWGGEQITSLVKDYLFKDKFLIASELTSEPSAGASTSSGPALPEKPAPALLNAASAGKFIVPEEMGLNLGDLNNQPLSVGQWFKLSDQKGIFFSVIEARAVEASILESYKKRTKTLEETEASAAAYLVAYDLDKFNVGFTLGTSHPSAEWSDRAREEVRPKNSTKGPDGFDNFNPMVMTGKVNPYDAQKVVSTFTGGFKRSHSAFKWGKLSTVNGGSHYGFIENGVVFSTLQPDLATFIIDIDGRVDIKTWTKEDNSRLGKIRHARQNGVPIVEIDPETKKPMPGEYVGNWNAGNWSGTQASKQRALRAAICLQEENGKRFLIYAYFSSTTPNGMARVFQAYNCSYAMHLDMNALEHTYLAIYQRDHEKLEIRHLIKGMDVLDRKEKGQIVPRFVGTADNRDFFFLLKK